MTTQTQPPWYLSEGAIWARWETGEEIQIALLSTTRWGGGDFTVTDQKNERIRQETLVNGPLIAQAWAIPQLIEALEDIAQGKGAYDPDKLKHCSNAVEDMKATARAALDLMKGQP